MKHDNVPLVGLRTRRSALRLMGAAGAACLGAGLIPRGGALARTHDCVVRPEQTEGPFFVDGTLNRSDIRSDPADGSVRPGAPLALTLLVSRLGQGACQALAGARVDLWQCDAEGYYSDVRDWRRSTTGRKFLRGYQVTDSGGAARFLTVYPGWYPGRTVHLHFKIRTDPARRRGLEFTSQLYFDDALTDRVHAAAPYAARGDRTTRNRDDGIFRRGGEQLVLSVAESADGYAALFRIGLLIP